MSCVHPLLFGGEVTQCAAKPPQASHQQGWWGRGMRMDWYVAPTPGGGFSFAKALFDLTGAPAVPPRFGMGFMATYWGYDSMQSVYANMSRFRTERYPIDSFIMDYDWFGPEPCGAVGAQGGVNCGDFGYRRSFWAKQTFEPWSRHGPVPTANAAAGNSTRPPIVTRNPRDVLRLFSDLHMHFAGIRKPRTYSNLKLSEQSSWLLPPASDVGEGGGVNWDFSNPALRAWYVRHHLHFLDDGMDFWWNDEGETSWFTYLHWNEAQAQMFAQARPNRRHLTLNRAFQPGMQRFPAVSWTGDGQACGHDALLRHIVRGEPFVSCDLTSPDATTLVRQYQSAVFTPVMRVHAMGGTPRFPWFWGGPAHHAAFRAALEMRYTFLPFLYSLAHRLHAEGRPMAHPASWTFRADPHAASVYVVGGVLLPADLGLAHSTAHPPTDENSTVVYLPTEAQPTEAQPTEAQPTGTAHPRRDGVSSTREGVPQSNSSERAHSSDATAAEWYRWATNVPVRGGQAIRHSDLALDEMVLYVRAGTILTLQKRPASGTVQHSGEMGGALLLQLYSGRSGRFVMVEDDGISLDYAQVAKRATATRTTTWAWDDTARTLAWTVTGEYTGPNLFTTFEVELYGGGTVARAMARPLTAAGGLIRFSRDARA